MADRYAETPHCYESSLKLFVLSITCRTPAAARHLWNMYIRNSRCAPGASVILIRGIHQRGSYSSDVNAMRDLLTIEFL